MDVRTVTNAFALSTMVGECRMTVKKDLLLPWNHRLFTGVALLASAPRSSCINRVGQHGIQFQLEIFMTKLKGWGVRTRSFIPSGSFVCQYIGEVGDRRQSGSRLASDDDYLFHMGMFMNHDLCLLMSGLHLTVVVCFYR